MRDRATYLLGSLLVCLLASTAAGQGTFNVVHNHSITQGWPDAGGATARAVLPSDSTMVVFTEARVLGNNGKAFVSHFTCTGLFTYEEALHLQSPFDYGHGYIDPVDKRLDGALATLTEFDEGDFTYSRWLLTRYDANGDTLWSQVVQDTGYSAARQTRWLSNDRIIICGFNSPTSSTTKAYLVICDSSGSIITTRTYPNTLEAISVEPLDVGGAALAGYRLSGVDDGTWVMRVDSLGNMLWRRDIGGSNFATNGNVDVLQTQDGGIVAACTWMPYNGGPFSQRWNWFRKWDLNGGVQWTKQYNLQSSSQTYDLEELPNGDIIASGTEEVGVPPQPINKALLFRLTPDGDLIWLRRYYYYTSQSSVHNPYDVELTPDGGFVMAGRAIQGATDSLPGLAMVWLLKVDSFGCLVPGCQTVGIQEQVLGLEDALRVRPNPVAGGGSVTVEITLPEGLRKGPLRLSLIGADGRLVQEYSPPIGQQQFTVNAPCEAGAYFLHLTSGSSWLGGAKLVVR